MEIKITLFDCEDVYVGWTEEKDYEIISIWLKTLNQLEVLKLAKYCITQKGVDGECAIQEMINFNSDEDCKQRMLGRLNGK